MRILATANGPRIALLRVDLVRYGLFCLALNEANQSLPACQKSIPCAEVDRDIRQSSSLAVLREGGHRCEFGVCDSASLLERPK
jgi:hypothetical protein